MHFHHLYGCTPTPLASYLKALGILRLVAEQADSEARGTWQDEHFILATHLSEDELKTFFLEHYAPTPILGPWAARPGFFKKEKARQSMDAILQSNEHRFNDIKEAILACRNLLARHRITEKAQDDEKIDLLYWCRQELPRTMVGWLDACYVLRPDAADTRRSFPPVLGTGANEGSGSYVSNYIQAVELALLNRTCDHQLPHALFANGRTDPSQSLSLGHFVPDADASGNPWSLLFCLEAMPILASSVTRVSQSGFDRTDTASPFTTQGTSAGHSTSGDDQMRGEQWFPIWNRWASAIELRKLFVIGRSQIKVRNAKNSVDFARSLARAGVSAGIEAFERYGYYNRNNIKYYFAVPLGRWKVVAQPNQDLLADIDGWLNRFQRASKDPGAPARLGVLAKRLTDAVMAVAANGADTRRWQDLLLALADADACIATGTGMKAGIVTNLSPGWLTAADDHSPELRLALALATQHGIRHHWLPLDRFGKLKTTSEGRLARDPDIVCFGRDLVEDLIALVNRRIVKASQGGVRHPDMQPAHPALSADPRDLAAFLNGGLDHDRILHLGRALMMLDTPALRASPRLLRPPEGDALPHDIYTLLRFCLLPRHCTDTEVWRIPMNVAVFRRLAGGNLPEATRLAVPHLQAHGVRAPVQMATGNARLLAAAMAFPISCSTRDMLSRAFVATPNPQGEQR